MPIKMPIDIHKGAVFSSNSYGEFVIIDVINALSVKVKFLLTGFEIVKQIAHIRRGTVKDYLYPVRYGVAFFGLGEYSSTNSKLAYSKWSGMLMRCYCDKYQAKNPTYIGCSVSADWLNFQNFAKWFHENYIDGFELDKDSLIKGNKIYSKDTCVFLSRGKNIEASLCKEFNITSPEGVVYTALNMTQFCKERGLNQGHISSVILGGRKSHKGWTKHFA